MRLRFSSSILKKWTIAAGVVFIVIDSLRMVLQFINRIQALPKELSEITEAFVHLLGLANFLDIVESKGFPVLILIGIVVILISIMGPIVAEKVQQLLGKHLSFDFDNDCNLEHTASSPYRTDVMIALGGKPLSELPTLTTFQVGVQNHSRETVDEVTVRVESAGLLQAYHNVKLKTEDGQKSSNIAPGDTCFFVIGDALQMGNVPADRVALNVTLEQANNLMSEFRSYGFIIRAADSNIPLLSNNNTPIIIKVSARNKEPVFAYFLAQLANKPELHFIKESRNRETIYSIKRV